MGAPWRAWAALGVLMLAYTVSFIDRTLLSLLIPPIQRDLGISDTEASLLAGLAFAVFYTVMGIPLGRLADRWHRRNLIALGITVWCVMTAACGLARNFWQLFAARVGVGIGEASLSPAAYSLIADLFPRHLLGRAIAVYSIGLPVGSGLALLVGGLVIGRVSDLGPMTLPVVGELAPWQLTFVLVGLPGILVALLLLLVREPERRDRAASVGAAIVGAASGRESLGVRGQRPLPQSAQAPDLLPFLRRNRRVLLHHFTGLSLLVVIVYGSNAWIPTFFIRSHGWSATAIGYAYGLVFLTCGTAGLLAGGQLADRWWRQGRTDAHLRVVLLSLVTMAPAFALMGLVPSATAAVALLALATFTSSLHGGVAGAALQLITPNELRGQMTAVYFFIANLIGLGVGPSAVALITDFGFADQQALGRSIAVLALLAAPLSAVCLWTGLGPYRASVHALQTAVAADGSATGAAPATHRSVPPPRPVRPPAR
ncbi:MAG TPA: MFS transporter [Pseudomonadales bacterium]